MAFRLFSLLTIFFLVSSCASKPVLYPNSKLKKVGQDASKEDISRCMDEASKYLKSSEGKKILKGAGSGSIFGAAVGAISGLIQGDVMGGITSGAAVGAVGGGVGASLTPDQLKRSYVNKCLSDKGYRVIGWD